MIIITHCVTQRKNLDFFFPKVCVFFVCDTGPGCLASPPALKRKEFPQRGGKTPQTHAQKKYKRYFHGREAKNTFCANRLTKTKGDEK